MTHTPGPWEYNGEIDTRCQRHIEGPNNQTVAIAPTFTEITQSGTICTATDEEINGNAKLIAAAPELLEELKEARELIRIWHGDDCFDIYDRKSPEMKRINAAISKAEARS